MIKNLMYNNSYELLCTSIVAVLINLKLINYSFARLLNVNDGFFPIIMFWCYAVFLLSATINFFSKRGRWLSINTTIFLLIFIIIFISWYLFSLGVTDTNYIQFLAYIILPVIVSSISKMNANMLLTLILLIGTIALPVATQLIVLDYRNSLGMDISYAFVPTIIAAMCHITYFRKKAKRIFCILYIAPFFYLINLLRYGVRGPIFCIGITLIMILLFGPKSGKVKGFYFFIILGFLVIFNFLTNILSNIQVLFEYHGIRWYFLDKTIRLLLEEDLLHGRQYLIQLALEGFIDSFGLGKGLNSFRNFTGYFYPHNFLVQFLYEGGIIIFIYFSFLLINGTKKIIDINNTEKSILYIVLFCTSVPYFFISASMWNSPLLWLFVGYLINLISIPKTKNISNLIR